MSRQSEFYQRNKEKISAERKQKRVAFHKEHPKKISAAQRKFVHPTPITVTPVLTLEEKEKITFEKKLDEILAQGKQHRFKDDSWSAKFR